ncbi:MAG: glycosyltransferase family 4 protein [Candidatus Limnocylindrales bacterium]
MVELLGPSWRLALDAGSLHRQPAGVGVYVRGLAHGLSTLMPERLALIGVRAGVELSAATTASAIPAVPFQAPNYHAWLQTRSDRDARRTSADIVHYTNAAAPLAARLPFVLTVHDLSVLRLPRFHPMARLATTPVMLSAVARARAIIVPSRWTRRELVRGLRVSAGRVTVIEHAPYDGTQEAGAEDGVTGHETLERNGLKAGEFLLYVGTLEPRKNIHGLLAAFEQLAPEQPSMRLALVGAAGWHSEPIMRRIASSPVADRVVVTGHLEPAELLHLMRSCAAFAYVSVYEGYGMPIVEAMAAGAPVVTSRTTAMPEAAGGAAVLVDPFDPADICRGLRDALRRADELRVAGRARSAGRSWTTVAAEHIEVYRWAAGTKR